MSMMIKCRIKGTKFEVVVEDEEMVELSFTRTWNSSSKDKLVPLNIDKRYSLLLHIILKLTIPPFITTSHIITL